ncbi:MAG: carboxylesterase, partial [Mariprofundaceae bacterium]|nr:carboxylesterase [Mariprofundaceae bacterium]
DHIILAGFSQGAAMSLYVGLRQSKPFGGIMVLSGYQLLPEENAAIESCAQDTPIFIAHGMNDSVVDVSLGKHVYHYLTSQSMDVVWHDYSMEHSVCPEEIADIRSWLLRRFQVLA